MNTLPYNPIADYPSKIQAAIYLVRGFSWNAMPTEKFCFPTLGQAFCTLTGMDAVYTDTPKLRKPNRLVLNEYGGEGGPHGRGECRTKKCKLLLAALNGLDSDEQLGSFTVAELREYIRTIAGFPLSDVEEED